MAISDPFSNSRSIAVQWLANEGHPQVYRKNRVFDLHSYRPHRVLQGMCTKLGDYGMECYNFGG